MQAQTPWVYALIICKVLGATALITPRLHPKLKEWAYAGLTFNLVFAVISHMAVDKNAVFILMPIVVGIILAVPYLYNQKIQNNGKNKF
ncbi:DoxX family protein [Niabella aquatica]